MVTRLINDIRNSLDNKCYFAALSLALALADICGVVKLGENSSVAKRYITWDDKKYMICQWILI